MKHTYAVSGLSCSACVARVRDAVAKLPGAQSVSVTLSPPRLQFEGDVERATVSDTVASVGSYRLHSASFAPVFVLKRGIKKFLPLIVMFALVLLWTAFSQVWFGFSPASTMAQFMGGYFLLFGALKAFNWKKFVPAYRAYDAVAARSTAYAWSYPAIELGLGILYVTGVGLFVANVITLLLMSQKAYSVHQKLKRGGEVQCACLGGFFSIPVARVTFFEDLLMAVMAALMLANMLT